jgi:tetratricopeptide (TPR) repeat protein
VAPAEAMPKVRSAAEKALSLDPSLASAHTVLGVTHLVFDWDMPGAIAEFDRAIALNPNDADAHLWRASALIDLGRFDEGLRENRRSLELDPLNPWINAKLGWNLYFARRYGESAAHLRDAIRLDPDYFIHHVFLGLTLEQQGDHRGAVTELETAVARDTNPDDLCQLAHAYGTAGRRNDALRMIRLVLDRRANTFIPAADIAYAYAGLGDREQFFTWLDRALEDRSEFLTMLNVDPAVDPMRNDPRFKAALRRIGFAKAIPTAQVSALTRRE